MEHSARGVRNRALALIPKWELRKWELRSSTLLQLTSFVLIVIVALLLAPSFNYTAAQTAVDRLDWPFYGNDPGGMRYVNADQINPSNVASLQPAWIFHTKVTSMNTSFESQPIIVDGVMYVTSPHGHVFALEAASGALKWTFNPEIPPLSELAICCGQTNRGVAVGNGKVFVGQLDATLVALDASSGRVLWKVTVDRWQDRWTETMAPLFLNNKVIIGASGGEYQRRGHVRAYDADTGGMLWEFFTVPGPGEFGNDTWAGESWRTGGGTVWTTPAADPQLGLIYITTGNAAPDENGSERAGMNLFTASIVALDVNTGQRRWHFQEVHHDIWDYDSPQPAHLFTLERNNQQIPAIGHANKNGFYFILDRRDGKPLYEVRETPVPTTEPAWQNAWPTQPVPAIDPLIPQNVEGAPPGVRTAPMYTPPREEPTLIQPHFESGPEWPPSAYSPRTRFAYLQAGGYQPGIFRAIPAIVNSFGSTGGASPEGIENYGLFVAIDTTTGKTAWRKRLPEKMFSGVVVSGDLVFFGENNGRFDAVDAKSGAVLWTFKSDMPGVGGANGAPAVYSVNGTQYVVMAFGGNNGLQGSTPGDALVAFALPPAGRQQPTTVDASPRQVPTGLLPDSATQPPAMSAPADARVVELVTHDTNYLPESFTALAGEKIAVRIVNTGTTGAGFIINLPSGRTGLRATVPANQSGFFVFTAPNEPGVYEFFGMGNARFQGMTGQMRVGPGCAGNPCVSTPGIVSSATLRSGAVAPGEFVTIFGRGIGPETGVLSPLTLSSGSLPTSLGDTQVLFEGVAAPLVFAQANQVNAVVPFEMAGRNSANVQIIHGGRRTEMIPVSVVAVQPGVFTTTGGTAGQGIILNEDGSANSASNPAGKGSIIKVFATGAGQTVPPGVNGAPAADDSMKPRLRVEALVGGIGGQVLSARVPRGVPAGVLQVDVRLPGNLRSGPDLPVEIAVGDVMSPPTATVAVR
jgi:quinohemoprotein ethanol dehydrogenase